MAILSLKNRLKAIEESKKVKRELPWDCKNLMHLFKDERARQSIIFKFAKLTGEACMPPDPYRLEVEDTRELSREALEFLSLSAEKQAQAVNYYCPSKQYTQEEGEEMRREILERLSKISVGQRAQMGCVSNGRDPYSGMGF